MGFSVAGKAVFLPFFLISSATLNSVSGVNSSWEIFGSATGLAFFLADFLVVVEALEAYFLTTLFVDDFFADSAAGVEVVDFRGDAFLAAFFFPEVEVAFLSVFSDAASLSAEAP